MSVKEMSHEGVEQELSDVRLGNGVSIEVLRDGPWFHGLGRIEVSGVSLRSAERPILPQIRTPDGVELVNWRIIDQQAISAADDEQAAGEGIRLTLEPQRQDGGQMEWMVHEVRPRYNTGDWSAKPQPASGTRLELDLHPIERTVDGRGGVGFRYQYRYVSEDLPIYRLLDRATWEPGGQAVGNEIWARTSFTDSIRQIDSVDDVYWTGRYMAQALNPYVFQFVPLQTKMQGFTLTANQDGALIIWPTQVAHIRSLFEKRAGDNVIAHWHEHCGDLDHELTTSPVEVLWFTAQPGSDQAGRLDRVRKFNLYGAFTDLVYESLHEQVGMRRERAVASAVMEEWGPANLDDYTDVGLPALAGANVERVHLANHFRNNMNAYGLSNMCCTVELRVADSIGEDRLARLCEQAKALGVGMTMWGNTALSSLSSLETKANDGRGAVDRPLSLFPDKDSPAQVMGQSPTRYVRNPSGGKESDHYAPRFIVMNLRDPAVVDYWLKSWAHLAKRTGMSGIFLDSSFNLSNDKFSWIANPGAAGQHSAAGQEAQELEGVPTGSGQARILSQYHAHLSLMAQMQGLGYEYSGEDHGVFGVNRAGGPTPARRAASMPMWADTLGAFDAAALREVGQDPDEVFFRGLAYRAMWLMHFTPEAGKLSWHYGGPRQADDEPTPRQCAWLGVFKQVQGHMTERTILPGETAVVYRGAGRTVIWSFERADLAFDQRVTAQRFEVDDEAAGEANGQAHSIREPESDRLETAPRQVYLIDDDSIEVRLEADASTAQRDLAPSATSE